MAAASVLAAMSFDSHYEPGTVLRGKYRVDRLLGKGGMGFVLEATHLDLEQRVAIKLLHPELRVHAELVERFLREGRAASRLRSEHIARVLDVDRLEDGTPLLVMEYLEGADLSSVRRSRTPLSIRDATEYVLQAASAIAEAHDKHIVHRDIKPANLFLARLEDRSMTVKVLDFGISKLSNPLGGSEPSVTSTSMVLGSGEYMSPEQMLSAKDVDLRTDVWALGVVLFELLTAQVPFPGDTLTQVCAMVMSQPAPMPRSVRPDIPEALEAVISRCLEKDREKRYPTVRDFMRELQGSLGATAVGLGPPSTLPIPDGVGGAGNEAAPSPLPVHFGESGTTVLPTTPVPLRHDALIGTKASDAPPPPTPVAMEAGPTTSLSGQGFPTNAAVSSDPLPAPPRKTPRGALIGFAVVAAVGIGSWALLANRSSAPSAGHADAVSATAVSPEDSTPPVASMAYSDAPAAAVSAAVTAAPTASSSATPVVLVPPQSTPPPAKPPSVKPPQRPKPAKTSGID